MRLYRACWLTLAYVIGAAGAAVALVHESRSVNAAVAVATGVTLASVATAQQTRSPETFRRRIMITVAAGAIVCFAVAGLVLLFGSTVLPAALIILLISPTALHWLSSVLKRAKLKRQTLMDRRVSGDPDLMQQTAPPGTPAKRAVQSLSDTELHAAWRVSSRSLARLQASPDLREQLQHLALRQQYLDELERRHPRTFHQWLADGAPPDKMPTAPSGPTGDASSETS